MTGLFSLTTKQQKKLHKFFSAMAIFSLFLQAVSGIFYFKPVLAEGDEETTQVIEQSAETTQETTAVSENTSTPEVTPTPEPTPSVETPAEITPTPTEEVTPTPEPTETNISQENSDSPQESEPSLDLEKPTEDPTSGQIIPTPVPIEKVCLTEGQEIKDTTNENWEINLEQGWAQTKEPVKLGVRYLFPQENKVSVTFKCLPKDGTTPLKIQKIKIKEI